MWRRLSLSFLFALIALSPAAEAQRRRDQTRVPVETPPGIPQQRMDSGIPWPVGLGKKEALTGVIKAIDRDQMLVHSLDLGDVLFWVDGATIVRVDKFRLDLKDLRKGDAVAVRMKNIKGRGPLATEILPHPDVRTRKERGEPEPAPTPQPVSVASTGGHGAIVPTAAESTEAAAAPAAPPEPEFPALPPGSQGVVGTVEAASDNELELRDQAGKTEKVLVTGVTLYKRAGSDSVVNGVKKGDRVAVAGDRLDDGQWIARQILVALPPEEEAMVAPSGAGAARSPGDVSPDGLSRFSGVITSTGDGEIRVKTSRGERVVLVTGITEVRRMGTRAAAGHLRVGDEVDVTGDPLDGGLVSAREVTVTRLAGS